MVPRRAVGVACGKLYLCGEYAVMDPRGEALVAGVNRYVTATAELAECSPQHPGDPAGGAGSVSSSYYPTPRHYRVTEDGAVELPGWPSGPDLVAYTLELSYRLVVRAGIRPTALRLSIGSDLEDAETGRKLGLGSSGAVVVAVCDAVTAAHGLSLTAPQRFRAGLVASARAGAAGSGGDCAAAAYGGVIRYRRADPEAVAASARDCPEEAVFSGAQGAKRGTGGRDAGLGSVQRVPVHPSVRLLVGWTGRPVATDSQLAQAERRTEVEQAAARCALVAGASACARRCALALSAGDAPALKGALRRNRELLARYAAATGVCIETRELAALADSAERRGMAAKSSGAGGGDCGIALSVGEGTEEELFDAWRAAGIVPLDVGWDTRVASRG